MTKKDQAYRFSKFWQLSGTEKYVLIKALFLSFVFYFTVKILPLKYYIHLLKSKSFAHTEKVNFGDSHRIITKSIARLERVIPWPMTCLNKVLTARYLYRNFGIDSSIHLSLFESRGKRCAHASLIIRGTLNYLPMNEDSAVKIYL